MARPTVQAARRTARGSAIRFIVLLGVVSLFADMTYEGARSATGPFLLALGAGPAVVGLVAGAGELAGYAGRLLSGYLADRTARYWLLTGLGYAVNLLAVPGLALAGRWQQAAALVLLERVGKAIRTPSRDVMLAAAARQVGTGLGFGLHEALDQIGAVAGPLMVAAAIWASGDYRKGFALLAVPALLALATLALARVTFPEPAVLDEGRPSAGPRNAPHPAPAPDGPDPSAGTLGPSHVLPPAFRTYLAFVAVSALGFAPFALVAFHLKAAGLVPEAAIPLLFAAAMAVDAVAALAAGRAYDRRGLAMLVVAPLATAVATPLLFSRHPASAAAGVVLWGVTLGIQESILRAAVAGLVPEGIRGRAYGLFHTVFGLALFLGSGLIGALYGRHPGWASAFAGATQLAALPLWWGALRAIRQVTPP